MILEILRQIDPLLYALILSATPVLELRAGIPVALAGGYNVFYSYIVCVAANMLAIPIGYIFLETFHKLFLRSKLYTRLFNKYVEKLRNKSRKPLERWGDLGLIIFVAVPIPGSGAYTAVLLSWLLGIRKRHMFFSILIGVLLAGIIVTAISLSVINGLKS